MTNAVKSIRILICDDHSFYRDGLRAQLTMQPDFQVVGEAEDGGEAIALAAGTSPDVILMDLSMPRAEIDGLEAIAAIRARNPKVRILVITNYEWSYYVDKATAEGASGYVIKNAPREEIFEAIRQVASGRAPLAPSVAARLLPQLRDAPNEQPTPREVEALAFVAQGKANKEIAREMRISEATVGSHLTSAFEKLGAVDRTSAVVAALERGLIPWVNPGGS